MKKIGIVVILGLLVSSSFFFPGNKEAQAAQCGRAADGVCCVSGTVCMCLPDDTDPLP